MDKLPPNAVVGDYLVNEEWAETSEVTRYLGRGTREACLAYMKRARWPSKRSGLTLGLSVVVDSDWQGRPLGRLATRAQSYVLR